MPTSVGVSTVEVSIGYGARPRTQHAERGLLRQGKWRKGEVEAGGPVTRGQGPLAPEFSPEAAEPLWLPGAGKEGGTGVLCTRETISPPAATSGARRGNKVALSCCVQSRSIGL